MATGRAKAKRRTAVAEGQLSLFDASVYEVVAATGVPVRGHATGADDPARPGTPTGAAGGAPAAAEEAYGPLARARANVLAIRALKRLESVGATADMATPGEMAAMAAYCGWGGSQGAFALGSGGAWGEVARDLRDALTDDEWASARSSILTAFYTPREVSGAVLGALADCGLGRGEAPDRVLEPGCGTGAIMSATPDGMRLEWTGVEVDDISARMARVLVPGATVLTAALEDCDLPEGSFEAVVGNVPYSQDIKVDAGHGRRVSIHDYFVLQAVRAVRPGGVVAVLTSTYTLDRRGESTRVELARQAELVGMARLPRGTFADTKAMCDVVVLRRRPEPIAEEEARALDWVGTTTLDGAEVNARLAADRALALGDVSVAQGRHGPELAVVRRGGEDLGDALRACLARQLGPALGDDLHAGMGPRMSEGLAAVRPDGQATFEVFEDGGILWYGDAETVERFEARPEAYARAFDIVRLRDQVRALYDLEADPTRTDAEVEAAIAGLRGSYDSFVEAHGRLCERRNRVAIERRRYSDASLGVYVWSLEEVDRKGRFVGLSRILEKRVVSPVPPMPESVETAREALAVSMDRRGRVDVALVARLLGTDEAGAMEALGDDVVVDPDTGEPMLAEEYLSGDVGARLDRVRALLAEAEGRPERAAQAEARAEAMGERDLSLPHEPDKGADAVRRELVRSGAWGAMTDPEGAAVAVDALAAVRVATGEVGQTSYGSGWAQELRGRTRGGGATQATNLLEDLLEDMRPWAAGGATATQREEVVGDLLYVAAGDWARSAKARANGYDVPLPEGGDPCRLLWRAVTGGAVGDGCLARMLGSLSEYVWGIPGPRVGQAVERVLSDAPEGDDGWWSQERGTAALGLLRESPEVLEYLHLVMTEPGGDGTCRGATREGWLEYHATRERALAEARARHPVDEGRVAALRALEARLEGALPARLGRERISCSLGSAWVPPAVVIDFMEDELGMGMGGYQGRGAASKLSVTRSPATGAWSVTGTTSGVPAGTLRRYGTTRATCLALLDGALNGRMVRVTKPDPNDPSGKARVTDPVATQAAWQRRQELEAAFEGWVWKDEGRARTLERLYNGRFNTIAQRRYDGSYLTLPGKAADIELRPHQLDAVARILQSREGTLVAHVVGAGKTWTGVAACMEAKRLGKATKPMVVVPNHLTRQWASDFVRLYPNARVLAMDDVDTSSADAARAFWGRAAAGDWDAVVVAQSRFTQLGLSKETQVEYYAAREAEYAESAREASGRGDRLTQKQAEAMRQRAHAKMESLRGRPDIEGVTFERTGCDFLLVDEAHSFKNLAVTGPSVSGMSVAPSAKCEDLLAKCEWMRRQGRGSNIVFATGTPVSNTMAELYNMQRYLAPSLLEKQGVSSFTSWANTFGKVTETTEVRPEGNGFAIKQRFSKFVNLPELMAAFHSYTDLRTQDMVQLDVPECEQVLEAVPATEEQQDEVRELGRRAERVRRGEVPPEEDNLLKVTGDGRKVALDPKLMHMDDPDWEPMEGGKVQRCAENVMEVWEGTREARGTQLVFCDSSTPASGRWNTYEDLADRLVELGMPRGDIAFVTDAGDSPKRRDELFERVRKGEVRVLMGSTQKLGTGTNVQDRLVAIHDLDCPWRPSDLEQRLGRIQRQGNRWPRVYDYRYVSEGTFDAYLYQTVERKARFIAQVFTSRSPARSMDDLDQTVLGYAEIKAAATGDPAVARRMGIENEVSQLMLLRQAHEDEAADARRRLEQLSRPMVRRLEADCGRLEADREAFEGAFQANGGKRPETVRTSAGELPEAEASAALRDAAALLPLGRDSRVGSYAGLDVVARVTRPGALESGGRPELHYDWGLAVPGSDAVHWCPPGNYKVTTRLWRCVERDRAGAGDLAGRLEDARREMAELEALATSEWDGAERLRALRAELAELDEGMGLAHGAGPSAAGDTPAAADVLAQAIRAREGAKRRVDERRAAGRAV